MLPREAPNADKTRRPVCQETVIGHRGTPCEEIFSISEVDL